MPSPDEEPPILRARMARNNAAAPPITTAANPSKNATEAPGTNPSASSPNNPTAETGGNPGVLQILSAIVGILFYITLQVFPFYSLWSYMRQGGWTCILLLPSLLWNCYDAYCSLRNCVRRARENIIAAAAAAAAAVHDREMQ